MFEKAEESSGDENNFFIPVASSEQEPNHLSLQDMKQLPLFMPSTNVSTEHRFEKVDIGINEGELSDGVNCPSSEEEEQIMQDDFSGKIQKEVVPLESASIADMIRQSLANQAEIGVIDDPAVIPNPQQAPPEEEKEKDKSKNKKRKSKKESKKKEKVENSPPVVAKVVSRTTPSNIPLRAATPINLVIPPASVIPSMIANSTNSSNSSNSSDSSNTANTSNTSTSPSLPLRPAAPSGSTEMHEMHEMQTSVLSEQAVVPSLSTDQAIGVALSLGQIPSSVFSKSGNRSAGLDENALLSAQSISVLSNVVSSFEMEILHTLYFSMNNQHGHDRSIYLLVISHGL